MGFSDIFSKSKSHNQYRKSSIGSSSSRPQSPTMMASPQGRSFNQPLPDQKKYPNSHRLTRLLILEGKIHWNCCKCGTAGNQFAVHPADMDPDNLAQPFFLWGDSFCAGCSHNFCSTCIEGHSF
ncbi:hypothetical protein DASC09_038800 [Saccharomycopsis crataegensis]|uniref:Uncharacterized protein n=1 Tax=Saccharomycopsis crataegensis TaxID=43959 RepID=A0AAV5QPT6_9ASCO|nr:hypothetical protein DASC09_038800 [Saccharomycopsis crataegensis]